MGRSPNKILFRPTQTSIVLGVKIVAVITATIAFFSQDLIIVFNDALNSEITSYMLIIPFLLGYLIYRKRKILRAVMPLENNRQPKGMRYLPSAIGVLLCLVAVLVYWHGSYTFTPLEYHMFALPVFAAGLSLLLFNPETLRHLAFPLAFLLFLVPPIEILYGYGSVLSSLSTDASNVLANAVGVNSTVATEYGNPVVLVTRLDGIVSHLTVDVACSGIYSLIGFFVFATFIAYIARDKLWKRLSLFMVGMPLIYSLNILRITTIFAIDFHIGEDMALQLFHMFGGWVLILLGTLLFLLISEKVFRAKIFASSDKKCLDCHSSRNLSHRFCHSCGRIIVPKPSALRKSDAVKVAAVLLAIVLLIYVQAPVFALTKASPLIVVSTPSGDQAYGEIFPQKISDYDLSFAYRDREFENLAKQDMSLVYMYTSANKTKELVWVALEIASTLSSLHRWEVCLIEWRAAHGYQPKVKELQRTDVLLYENPPMITRFFAFNYTATNETQAVLYWFETTTFTINSTSQQKQVKISLIIENPQNLSDAKNEMEEVGRAIIDYWQPIKMWTQMSLFISENGFTLTAISGAFLVTVSSVYVIKTRRQKKANEIAYRKASSPGQQLIDAVKEAQEVTLPTLAHISASYQNMTGNLMEEDQLLLRLSQIEETGMIEEKIASVNDEPIQTWEVKLP